MCQHGQKCNAGADCGGKSCTEYAHIHSEYKEVVSEDVEKPAAQYACDGKPRCIVVAQERGNHLVEYKYGDGDFYGQQIAAA